MIVIQPQPGPQEKALASSADVVILGGAKGGGKSHALRMAPLRWVGVSGFHSVIFRRTLTQQTNPGGQWDKSFEMYPALGGRKNAQYLEWTFPSGATIKFAHLKQRKDWQNWQGTETAMFCFDQLEEFELEQFLKILGCCRTTSGVPTQVLASCNPDAESWLASVVSPWLADDGYVDPGENGTIKYFTVDGGELVYVPATWRDRNGQPGKSIVYFSADVWDNQILLKADPNYLSNLQAQSLVDRERYLGIKGRGGNWLVKAEAGKVFKDEWFTYGGDRPSGIPGNQVVQQVRFWDFAGKLRETRGDDPDWTAGVKLVQYGDGSVVIDDAIVQRVTPFGLDKLMVETAASDGVACKVRWQRDPGQAGLYQERSLRKLLSAFDAMGVVCPRDKVERAKALSIGLEDGSVKLGNKGNWQGPFRAELVAFPDGEHDDQVDAASGGFRFILGHYHAKIKQSQSKM